MPDRLTSDNSELKKPARCILGAIALDMVTQVRRCSRAIVSDIDTEHLHRYRVLLRTLGTLIRYAGELSGPDPAAWGVEMVESLRRRTGRLRDLDVAVQLGEGGPNPAGIPVIVRERDEERAAIRHELAEESHGRILDDLEHRYRSFASESSSRRETIRSLARRALRRSRKEYRALARTVNELSSDEMLHRLRIRAKRIRYATEVFGPYLRGRYIRVPGGPGRELQRVLGEYLDTTHLIERIRLEPEILPDSGYLDSLDARRQETRRMALRILKRTGY